MLPPYTPGRNAIANNRSSHWWPDADVALPRCRTVHTTTAALRQSDLRSRILEHDPTFAWNATPSDGFEKTREPQVEVQSPFASMDEGELIDHCRQSAKLGQRDLVETILVDFERPSYTTAQCPSSSDADSPRRRRRSCMIALLEGTALCNDKAGHLSAGQIFRIHQLITKDCQSLQDGPALSTMRWRAARKLATLLSPYRYAPLFAVFQDLQRRLIVTKAWGEFPSTVEVSNTLQFCLTRSIWRNGGFTLAKLYLDHLLSSESFNSRDRILQEAAEDYRAWSDDTTGSKKSLELFSRLILVRIGIQLSDPVFISEQFSLIMTKFTPFSQKAKMPTQYLLSTIEALFCLWTPTRNSSGGTDLPYFQLLKNLDSAMVPLLLESPTPRLQYLCDIFLRGHCFEPMADLLLHYQSLGVRITQMITPFQLIRLARGLALQYGMGAVQKVSQLTGFTETQDLKEGSELLSVDFTGKRLLLKTLMKTGLKRQVAQLWTYWTQPDMLDHERVIQDSAIMLNVVRLFAKEGRERRKSSSATQPQPQPATPSDWSRQDSLDPYEVLQKFLDVKTGQVYTHSEMTTLAAAYFHLGEKSKAISVYVQLLHRREVPDEKDLLVLIGAVASHDHRYAVRFYESFLRKRDTSQESSIPVPYLAPSAAVFDLLLRICTKNHDLDYAKKVALEGKRHLRAKRRGPLLLFYLRCWKAGEGRGKWDWPAISAEITTETALQLGSHILKQLIRYAATGTNIRIESRRQSPDAKVDRAARPHSTQCEDLLAAVNLLDTAARCLDHVDSSLFVLILDRLAEQADWLKENGGNEETKQSLLTLLDRVVASVRHTDQRRRVRLKSDLRPPLTKPIWEQIAGLDEESIPDHSIFVFDNTFRPIISTYLKFGDISGASQVYLWRKQSSHPKPILELDAELRRQLEEVLGDLDMLDDGTRPILSWNFDGKWIEKDKEWWKVWDGVSERESVA